MNESLSPAYFLGSREFSGDFSRVRACWPQGRLTGPDSREYEWVKIIPPVTGQPFGQAGDIEDLVLSPRHQGSRLESFRDGPISVQVYLVDNPVVFSTRSFQAMDVEMVAWGEIYRTKGDAPAATE